jgi:hypothetical protein
MPQIFFSGALLIQNSYMKICTAFVTVIALLKPDGSAPPYMQSGNTKIFGGTA